MWFLTLSHPAGLTVTRISMLTFFQIYIFFQITSIKNIVLLLTHSPQQNTHNNTFERMCITVQRNDVVPTDYWLNIGKIWNWSWSLAFLFEPNNSLHFEFLSIHLPLPVSSNNELVNIVARPCTAHHKLLISLSKLNHLYGMAFYWSIYAVNEINFI